MKDSRSTCEMVSCSARGHTCNLSDSPVCHRVKPLLCYQAQGCRHDEVTRSSDFAFLAVRFSASILYNHTTHSYICTNPGESTMSFQLGGPRFQTQRRKKGEKVRLRSYPLMFVSIMTFPLIVASALAAEGDWTIGSRTLPAPVAGSEALRISISSTPEVNGQSCRRRDTYHDGGTKVARS